MEEKIFNHVIEARRLASMTGGYYALIDGKVDFEIPPSKYPKVVIRRIKAAYLNTFICELDLKSEN